MNAPLAHHPRIGIIGGGFTGAVFAVHLARAATNPLDIEIIEPREKLGAGLAYGSCEPEHRVNVPSDRLTVFTEDPHDFSNWMKRTGAWEADAFGLTTRGDHYSRRHDFGAYAASLVADAAAHNPSGSTIAHRRSMATGLAREGAGWRMSFEDGRNALYDEVVLCATYGRPAFRWKLVDGAEQLPHLVRDPWDWTAIKAIPRDADVFIIGTGLTMCDVVVTLRKSGHTGKIRAVSRRALTPRQHGDFDGSLDLFENAVPPGNALDLLRFVRRRIDDLAAQGRSWHAVVDAVRRNLACYWSTLPVKERSKIVRRLRSYWDVHRFRMAPQVAQLLETGQREGWLELNAGHIGSIGREGEHFAVTWTPKGEAARTDLYSAIVNCTGPDGDLSRSGNPLLRAAIADGFVRPDALRIGLDVDAHGAALNRDGEMTPHLWAAGPLARAIVGEATGVPEASAHARHVAEALAETLALNVNA